MGCYVIAEAGVNHNGDLEIAKQLIDAAAVSGADAVKFQTFKTSQLVARGTSTAGYQATNMNSNITQDEMLRSMELKHENHEELMQHCRLRGIEFLSSPFDFESAEFLHQVGLKTFKVPSGEINNLPLLEMLAGFQPRKIILSTGMSTMGEIETALNILMQTNFPRKQISVLHCNTDYPTQFSDVHLRAMQTIGRAFNVEVGYSDHTLGIEVPIAAVALGAQIIEKHFTLDKTMNGPDHKASLEPSELAAMVKAIRNIEQALGSNVKSPTQSELKNKSIVRKSIVAKAPIQKGEKFTTSNITVKRPEGGRSPLEWNHVLGQTATRSYVEDEKI